MGQRDKGRALKMVLAWREHDLIFGMKEKGLGLALPSLLSA